MTVNLAERQFGFHATTLGFPSIETCMAIVLVVPTGLYGFHNFGGNDPTQFADKANVFRQCLTQINGAVPTNATRLYGVTHVGARSTNTARWKNELVEFATRINYTGKISGYDLTGFQKTCNSAYVEFRKNGSKCDCYVEAWDNVAFTKAGANPWGNNLISTKPTAGVTVINPVPQAPFFDPITPTANLRKISKTGLRG